MWNEGRVLAGLRIVTGLLVFPHGVRKLLKGPVEAVGGSMIQHGFPEWFAWLVTLGELAGLLLAVGLFTRLSGAAVAATMGAIAFFVQAPKLAEIGTGAGVPLEYPILLAALGLAFALRPPREWSLDARLGKRGRR